MRNASVRSFFASGFEHRELGMEHVHSYCLLVHGCQLGRVQLRDQHYSYPCASVHLHGAPQQPAVCGVCAFHHHGNSRSWCAPHHMALFLDVVMAKPGIGSIDRADSVQCSNLGGWCIPQVDQGAVVCTDRYNRWYRCVHLDS